MMFIIGTGSVYGPCFGSCPRRRNSETPWLRAAADAYDLVLGSRYLGGIRVLCEFVGGYEDIHAGSPSSRRSHSWKCTIASSIGDWYGPASSSPCA